MAVREELKTEILQATRPVAGTPAEHYLISRGFEFLHSDFAEEVKWFDWEDSPHWQTDRHSPVVPKGYVGAICYIYRYPQSGEVAWIETDMLNALGERQPRKRYSFGSPKGAVFGHLGSCFGEWHICEGPIDVMRVHQLRFGVGVVSMGGTANTPPLELFARGGRCFKVFIHSDGDPAGQSWARQVRGYLIANDIEATILYYPAGQDVASYYEPYNHQHFNQRANNEKTSFPPDTE